MSKIYKQKKTNSIMNNIFKKILILSILMITSLINVNSAVYDFTINANKNFDSASILAYSTPNLVPTGISETNNFELTTTPMYVLLSATGNASIDVNVSYPSSIPGEFITKPIHVLKTSPYIFEISPQNIGDTTAMIFTGSTGNLVYSYAFTNDNFRDTDTITETFVGAVKDLISINIGFWKLFYYLFIFSIIIGGLGLLVNFAFKMYDWSDKVSSKKKEIFSGGHNKRDRD